MSNSWKASLQQATQGGMTTVLGLLKSDRHKHFVRTLHMMLKRSRVAQDA